MNRLNRYFELIEDERLRWAVKRYTKLNWEELSMAPASRSYHHTRKGGLLDHIVEVLDIGLAIIRSIPESPVDVGHFVAAAILHDAGKAVGASEESTMVGLIGGFRIDHAVLALLDFAERMDYSLPVPVKLAILAHMGGWSKTSVFPDDLLSSVLHAADLISSRIDRQTGGGHSR